MLWMTEIFGLRNGRARRPERSEGSPFRWHRATIRTSFAVLWMTEIFGLRNGEELVVQCAAKDLPSDGTEPQSGGSSLCSG